jgi:hypothetical protein
MPTNFHIIDYPDYPVRSLAYWEAKLTAFFGNTTGLTQEGKERLDYLANLKLSYLILGFVDALGYNGGKTANEQLFAWDGGDWVEKTNAYTDAYWSQFAELTEYIKQRKIFPIFTQPFLWYATVNNYDVSSFPEGVFCNQLLFEIGNDDVARPIPYSPALRETDNRLINGGFERAQDTSTVRNQSPIHLSNYYHIDGASSLSLPVFQVPRFSELDIRMFIKSESQSVFASLPFAATNCLKGDLEIRGPGDSNTWTNVSLPVVSDSAGNMQITFPSTFTFSKDIDHVQVLQSNVVRNPGFEYSIGSDVFEWDEDVGGGTISVDTVEHFSGSSSLKVTRSGSGMTRISQDITSHPNQIHTATIYLKHNVSLGAYCEIYNLENGLLAQESNVYSREVNSVIGEWYKQEFTFTTTPQGRFVCIFACTDRGPYGSILWISAPRNPSLCSTRVSNQVVMKRRIGEPLGQETLHWLHRRVQMACLLLERPGLLPLRKGSSGPRGQTSLPV